MKLTVKDKQLFMDEQPLDLANIEVLEDLSHGPKAHVFKVFNNASGRYEALKVLTPGKGDYAAETEKIQSQLEHGNGADGVAAVYATGTVNDQYYGLMEYIDGISLAKYLLQNPDFSARHRYLMQILQALKEIYVHGEFHSDILADNIMIDEENEKAFLIDFGSSRFASSKSDSKNSKLLLKLCVEVLPELKDMPLLSKELPKKKPLFILVIMEKLTALLRDIKLRSPDAWDQYSLIQYIVLAIDSIKTEYEKGGIKLEKSKVFKFFEGLPFPKEKIKILKSWYLKIAETASQ